MSDLQQAQQQRMESQAAQALSDHRAAIEEIGGEVDETQFTSLGAPYDMDDHLYATRSWMTDYAMYNGRKLPRFGLLSHMLISTPVHLYDNPVMNNITKTGFTDGVNIFINVDFYDKLLQEEQASNGSMKGPVLMIMHEMMHKMCRHVSRHAKYNRRVANLAEDLSINTRLQKAYPDMKWPLTLSETGVGFGTGEKEKYAAMSEEAIILELLGQRKKKLKEIKPPGKDKGQPGDGSGGGDPDDAEPSEMGAGQGGGEEADDLDDRFGGKDDEHTISQEELAQRMKDGGMEESMKRISMPDPGDKEALDRAQKNADLQRVDAINRAVQEMEESKGQYPGADIVSYCADMLRAEAKGKLRWRLEFRAAVMNARRESVFVEDDDPADIFHVDDVTEILGDPLYMGTYIQRSKASVVLFMIDVSGSMGNPDVRVALTEAFALKRAANNFTDTASEVLVLQCDTHVKENHLIELNEGNVEKFFKQGIQRVAMGGTDLGGSLREAMKLRQVRDKEVRAVIFVTDSYDAAPKWKDLGIKDRKTAIIYAIVPSAGIDRAEAFSRELDHGRVVYIDDQAEVDLTENFMKTMAQSPKAQSAKRRGARP